MVVAGAVIDMPYQLPSVGITVVDDKSMNVRAPFDPRLRECERGMRARSVQSPLGTLRTRALEIGKQNRQRGRGTNTVSQ